jgi:RNA polymerase sigma factor (sigma-70 family)
MTALNDAQKDLVSAHTDIVKWAIYGHIKVNENVHGLGYDDLFQEGCLWLCKAATTYDSGTAQFNTYAQVVVRNGLLTYCKKMSGIQKKTINMGETPADICDGLNDADSDTAGSAYDALLSDAAAFGLIESVKPEYSGIARLGIEALELKMKGYTGAEIAQLWGVEQNHVGAWISRAKSKLRENERFMTELKAVC